MKYFYRLFLLLSLVLPLVLLTGCNRSSPTPVQSTPNLSPPTPLPLPTRPARTPTSPPAVVAATPTPAATTAPASAPTEGAQTSIDDDVVSWAYVSSLYVSLRQQPGGRAIATLHAGDRLDILGASFDKHWLKVRYRPDSRAEGVTGWIPTSTTRFFVDLAEIPVADLTTSPDTTPVPAGDIVTQATVSAHRLNFRTGPGMDQSIIGQLVAGEEVGVVGRSDNSEWLQVQTARGQSGWAAARWLKVATPLSDLPVVGQATSAVPKETTTRTASAVTGRIVFQESSGGAIYIMNADGSDLHQVTTGLDPAFSPDGERLAVARWTGQKGVWIIDLSDGNQHLVFGDEHARSPSWAPDGQNIIFERVGGSSWYCRETPLGCYTDDVIRDFFGGHECRDFGFWGVYCISDFAKDVHVNFSLELTEVNLSDGNIHALPVPTFAYAPYHHPLNSDVMMLLPDGIAVVSDKDDTPPRKIITVSNLGAPVYSPDGRYIYVSHLVGDHWDIWRYNEDGANPVSLTRPPDLRDRPIHNVAPAVSPDGRSILFLTDREGDGSEWKLWIMNNDGGNQRPFAPEALANIHFKFDFGRERVLDWK